MAKSGDHFGQAVRAGSAGPPDRKKQFIRRIQELDRSKRLYEKFRDFCELAYCAVAKKTAAPERAEALEARYMQIVGTYQDKDTVRAYPELLALAVLSVQDGGCDFLGSVASELELLGPYNGQVFTPYDVARMTAQLTLQDAGHLIEDRGYITIHEPAAGSGVMILACADVIEGRGYTPAETMLVYATDLSPLAYHMCYLQLSFRGIPAWVERGNSLTLEQLEGAWTPPALHFHHKHGHLFDAPASDSQSARQPLERPLNTHREEPSKARPEFTPNVSPGQGPPRKEPPEQLGLF